MQNFERGEPQNAARYAETADRFAQQYGTKDSATTTTTSPATVPADGLAAQAQRTAPNSSTPSSTSSSPQNFSATPEQVAAGRALTQADRERVVSLQNLNREAERALVIERLRREAQEASPNDKNLQDEHVRVGLLEYERNIQKETLAFEQELARKRSEYGKDYNHILEAGVQYAEQQKQQAVGGFTTWQEYHSSILKGMEEEHARVEKAKQDREDLRQLDLQLSQFARANAQRDASALERALDAVNEQYRSF
jgi:hypothetical protein